MQGWAKWQQPAALLKTTLYPTCCDPKACGFLLKDDMGNTMRLHYKLHAFLQDGSAHKFIWNLKGDAATKFCLTLVTKKSGVQDEDGQDILVADEWDLSKIQQASDNEVAGTIARLGEKSKELSKADFQLWQQAVGWNYNPHDLLHCAELSQDILPISQFLHDWMHCFLVTGISKLPCFSFYLQLKQSLVGAMQFLNSVCKSGSCLQHSLQT